MQTYDKEAKAWQQYTDMREEAQNTNTANVAEGAENVQGEEMDGGAKVFKHSDNQAKYQ